jgi:hypothetical protein
LPPLCFCVRVACKEWVLFCPPEPAVDSSWGLLAEDATKDTII